MSYAFLGREIDRWRLQLLSNGMEAYEQSTSAKSQLSMYE